MMGKTQKGCGWDSSELQISAKQKNIFHVMPYIGKWLSNLFSE
jgi:hypothetical protein